MFSSWYDLVTRLEPRRAVGLGFFRRGETRSSWSLARASLEGEGCWIFGTEKKAGKLEKVSGILSQRGLLVFRVKIWSSGLFGTDVVRELGVDLATGS